MVEQHNNSRGRPFAKGNPGRPRGSRNKSKVMVEAMLEGEIEELLRRALERAKNGDSRLSRFFLAPFVSKDRRIQIDLPRLETAEDAPKAVAAVLRAIAEGEI